MDYRCTQFFMLILFSEGGMHMVFSRQAKKKSCERSVWFFPLVPLGHSGSKINCTVQAPTLIDHTVVLCSL